MKPSELPEHTADAVAQALNTLGLEPEDARVFVRDERLDTDEGGFLVATPVGLLMMDERLVSRARREWRLTTVVIPWRKVTAEVTVHTDRSQRIEGFLTDLELKMRISDQDEGTFRTTSRPPETRPNGLEDFTRAVLEWIEPLRA